MEGLSREPAIAPKWSCFFFSIEDGELNPFL